MHRFSQFPIRVDIDTLDYDAITQINQCRKELCLKLNLITYVSQLLNLKLNFNLIFFSESYKMSSLHFQTIEFEIKFQCNFFFRILQNVFTSFPSYCI